MANHVRRQIREAVKTLLTGLPTTGSRVFTNRLQRIDDADLPCLIISTDGEEIATDSSIHYDPSLERNLTVTIKAYAQANAGFDDVADAMIKEVEAVFNVASVNDATLSTLAKNIQLQNIDVEFDGNGEQPVAQASMQYLINYYTQASTPDISI